MPYNRESNIMAQRLGAATGGAASGGMPATQGSPPPQMAGQQPPAASPQQGAAGGTPGFREICEQVVNTLVRGDMEDLAVFGEIVMGPLQAMVQEHGQGQGAMQNAPAPTASAIPSM